MLKTKRMAIKNDFALGTTKRRTGSSKTLIFFITPFPLKKKKN